MPSDQTSSPIDVLVSVSRDAHGRLGAQIEDQLRCAVRTGKAKPGTRLPSTRDLAGQLGVSRHVVVDAYSQLAAEGYLILRQGARPQVSDAAAATDRLAPSSAPQPTPLRFDFRPSVPDVAEFPRAAWLRAMREAIGTIPNADLQYGDPAGVWALRSALANYLGRVRGVVADPSAVIVTTGYTQGLAIACRVLAATGRRRIALEDPTNPEYRQLVARAGLEPVPVPVDEDGLRVEHLARNRVEAVVVTPAHQHPTGAVLSGERRAALLGWLRERDAIVIEDDYDAEYRYDRTAIGALQGLEPDRIIYAGSASKCLAPALRLGWMVVPEHLFQPIGQEKQDVDRGTARIEQHALAVFLERGDMDRHLRRMRTRYRTRRDLLVAELTAAVPTVNVRGIAAGLHLTLELPHHDDEDRVVAGLRRRGIALHPMREYRADTRPSPPTLLIGYGQIPERAIGAGVREIAEVIRSSQVLS